MGYARAISVEFDGTKAARHLRKAGARLEVGVGTIRREFTSAAVGRARTTAGSLGGVHAHVRSGIGIMGDRATIKLDPRRQPAILGAEFGGGRRARTRQFPPWRGTAPGRVGYFLYPALRAEEMSVERLILSLIDRAL